MSATSQSCLRFFLTLDIYQRSYIPPAGHYSTEFLSTLVKIKPLVVSIPRIRDLFGLPVIHHLVILRFLSRHGGFSCCSLVFCNLLKQNLREGSFIEPLSWPTSNSQGSTLHWGYHTRYQRVTSTSGEKPSRCVLHCAFVPRLPHAHASNISLIHIIRQTTNPTLLNATPKTNYGRTLCNLDPLQRSRSNRFDLKERKSTWFQGNTREWRA